MEKLSDLSFHAIGFSPRLANVLEEGLGVVYVADLCRFRAEDLLLLPNFGDKLLQQVRTGLAEIGANLYQDPPVAAPCRKAAKPRRYSADIDAFG